MPQHSNKFAEIYPVVFAWQTDRQYISLQFDTCDTSIFVVVFSLITDRIKWHSSYDDIYYICRLLYSTRASFPLSPFPKYWRPQTQRLKQPQHDAGIWITLEAKSVTHQSVSKATTFFTHFWCRLVSHQTALLFPCPRSPAAWACVCVAVLLSVAITKGFQS